MQSRQVLLLLAAVSVARSSEPAEARRPRFHFTPRHGWTNDPNGLNWRRDAATGVAISHLFFQANPNSTDPAWGLKGGAYWGHAKSADLVHWQEVRASEIRGPSGSIVALPQRMTQATGGVKAVALVGEKIWSTFDEDELGWKPPRGCVDSGPPSGLVSCNASEMEPLRPGSGLLPPMVDAGATFGDSTASWVNASDGRIYSVYANIRCPRKPDGSIDQTCTWKSHGGTYQAVLFRTVNDSTPFAWEYVSIFWNAPANQANPNMGFTNCPDAFQLPDGRWAFAYLTHATRFDSYRVLWFTGNCDGSWNCTWDSQESFAGGGMVDASPAFVASQSFTEPGGRRVMWGWVPGQPSGAIFSGMQSVPRMIVADQGGPLRFLPLPELDALHTAGSMRYFEKLMVAAGTSVVIANDTTNSFHLHVELDLRDFGALRPSDGAQAQLNIDVFRDPEGAAGNGSQSIVLMTPTDSKGRQALDSTDTTGTLIASRMPGSLDHCSPQWCAERCIETACGGWTLVDEGSSCSCKLKGDDARFLPDAGSGCGGFGAGPRNCTSGIVGWQLAIPGLTQPVPVLPRANSSIMLEVFVDQIVVEVFLHDGRGAGSAVATFTSSYKDGETAVMLRAEGADMCATGSLWDMDEAISPPPSGNLQLVI